jgi:hypothetical protein
MFASLLMFFIVGMITLVVLSVAIAIIGGLLSLAGVLLFKIAPLLLLGWLAMKLFSRLGGSRGTAASDRQWLDG